MPSVPSPQLLPPPHDSSEIVDFPALKNWIGLVVRAVRARKRLIWGIVVTMGLLAAVATNVLPKTWRVSCRLLAQRNGVLTIQGDQSADAAPTRAASEVVMKRENILALIKQTNLLNEWKANRPFLFRMKDRIVWLLSKKPDDETMKAGLADYLASKMVVTSDESTISIQVDWRDPVLAFRLVDAAQRGFLEARHVQEVSTVAESVSILEGHAADVRGQIDAAVAEMQALRERKQNEEATKPPPSASAPVDAPAVRAPSAPAPPSPEAIAAAEQQQRRMSELAVIIDTKAKMINELDGYRARRLAELQAKVTEQRATYTEQHPAIAEGEQAIQAASIESPQVTRLKGELKQLEGEYETLRKATGTGSPRGRGLGRGPIAAGRGGGLGDVIRIEQEAAEERDPEIAYARSKLQFAITNYQQLEDQIRRSRIDLDTAQAAFKYRYSMVNPPQMPKAPIAPKVPMVIITALIAGLIIGMGTAAALELRAGVIVEPWQVQHVTTLPVLASIPLRGSSKGDGS